jgi:hypothetical protein
LRPRLTAGLPLSQRTEAHARHQYSPAQLPRIPHRRSSENTASPRSNELGAIHDASPNCLGSGTRIAGLEEAASGETVVRPWALSRSERSFLLVGQVLREELLGGLYTSNEGTHADDCSREIAAMSRRLRETRCATGRVWGLGGLPMYEIHRPNTASPTTLGARALHIKSGFQGHFLCNSEICTKKGLAQKSLT